MVRVRCSVCGLEDEARIMQHRWLQDPPYWLSDGDNDMLFCSSRCAAYFAEHGEGKVAK